MPQFTADLPEELLRDVEQIAQQFDQSPAEITERALAQFVRSLGEVRAAAVARRAATPAEADWGAVKHTLLDARCPFAGCPFALDCPVEVCPL